MKKIIVSGDLIEHSNILSKKQNHAQTRSSKHKQLFMQFCCFFAENCLMTRLNAIFDGVSGIICVKLKKSIRYYNIYHIDTASELL